MDKSMTHFEGQIKNVNGYPVMQFSPDEYKIDEIRDILFGMYNYLVSVDFMQIFSMGKLPHQCYKNKKIKAMEE